MNWFFTDLKTKTMEEAKKILYKHIQNFYKKNPMARFDDIPNKVFIEAMIEYGRLVKKWFIHFLSWQTVTLRVIL